MWGQPEDRPSPSLCPSPGYAPPMTIVVDISCPACGEQQALRKVGLGRYSCGACGHDFDQTEVRP